MWEKFLKRCHEVFPKGLLSHIMVCEANKKNDLDSNWHIIYKASSISIIESLSDSLTFGFAANILVTMLALALWCNIFTSGLLELQFKY